jgi:hypothetical protein
MAKFVSQPPSQKAAPVGRLFSGGMMPAAPKDVAALIVFDLRSLNLPASEGKDIEQALRDTLEQELTKRGVLKNRSAIDLSTSVHGIAIE